MTTSYNGWPASPSPAPIGVAPFAVNGISFPSGVKAGDVAVVFSYLAGQFHARVEPLVTPGCWGYFYKNSANSAQLISCHSSGTAIDFNAPKHPNGKRGTFTAAQVAAIRAILAELGGVVYWGGDAWGNGTPDEMHFEIREGVTAAQVAAVAARILGNPAPPAPPVQDGSSLPNMVYGQSAQVNQNWQAWFNAYPFRPALLPTIHPTDPRFGDKTKHAVQQVQARYGLAADGIVGPKTKALFWALGFRG